MGRDCDLNQRDLEKLLCWAKYLYWAELQWKSFEEEELQEQNANYQQFLAKMSLWYASLYVVIEAWKSAGLSDPVIDQLLNDNESIVSTLRRFRNSVYHYQDSIFEPKYLEFLKLGPESVYWTAALHDEFKSYLGKLPSRLMPDRDLANEFRESLKEIIGWFPDDTVELVKLRLQDRVDQGEAMLQEAKDWSSPEALDLMVTFSEIQELIKKTPDKPMKDLLDSN